MGNFARAKRILQRYVLSGANRCAMTAGLELSFVIHFVFTVFRFWSTRSLRYVLRVYFSRRSRDENTSFDRSRVVGAVSSRERGNKTKKKKSVSSFLLFERERIGFFFSNFSDFRNRLKTFFFASRAKDIVRNCGRHKPSSKSIEKSFAWRVHEIRITILFILLLLLIDPREDGTR